MKKKIIIPVILGSLVVAVGTTTAILLSMRKYNLVETDIVKPVAYAKIGAKDGGVNLVIEGSCSKGKIQYSLDKTNWSNKVPKGTENGDYKVYWYVKGDSKHNDFGTKNNPFELSTTVVARTNLEVGTNILFPSVNGMALIEGDIWPLLAEPWFFDEDGVNDGKFYYGINTGEGDNIVVNEWSTKIPTVTYNEIKAIVDDTKVNEVYINVAWYFDGGLSIYNSYGTPEEPIAQDVMMSIYLQE